MEVEQKVQQRHQRRFPRSINVLCIKAVNAYYQESTRRHAEGSKEGSDGGPIQESFEGLNGEQKKVRLRIQSRS